MKPINKKHSVSLMSVNRIRDAMGVPASPSPRPVRHRGESESQYSPKLSTALSRWDPLHYGLRGEWVQKFKASYLANFLQ